MNYSDLTILIPVRIDSPERLRNLERVLDDLSGYDGLRVLVLEADTEPKITCENHIFMQDDNPLFHRTKYINQLCALVKTPYLGVWDADVIVPQDQFKRALELLRNNEADMVFPFDGRCYNIAPQSIGEIDPESVIANNAPSYGYHTCGGAFVVNRQSYIAAGCENEKFTAWGPEDLERFKRWEIHGCRVVRTSGILIHLYHPRGHNSYYANEELRAAGIITLLETCRKINK